MQKRLISVVVPTRDRPDTLRAALASIRAHEADDVTFEILVGDNGDHPETPRVCDAFGAMHLPVAQNGAAAARNAGLAAATGELIAFLDDDDVWTENHIRPHLAVLDARPEIEAVFAQVIAVDDDMRPVDDGPWPWRGPTEGGDGMVRAMLSGYYPQIGATIVRASVREAVGMFDLALLGDQDWDWQLRIARRRKAQYIEAPCVLFRQRPPGTYTALRLRRLGFGRRVFLRHALPEFKVWGSWRGLTNSYRDVMWQYYEYFVNAATECAARGERGETWRSIWGAFRTFPMRATFHMIAPKPLQKAALSAIGPRHRDGDAVHPA